MGRKIRNKILDDFNNTYNCKLTPEDIISKTNYFNETLDDNYYKHQRYKLKLKYTFSCLYTLIICATICTFSIFIVNKFHKVDYLPEQQYITHILSEEDVEFIIESSNNSYYEEKSMISISDTTVLLIYQNLDVYTLSKYIYYYKVIDVFNSPYKYNIEIDDKVLTITNENSFGILTTTLADNSDYDVLSFKIINNDKTYNHVISIPNNRFKF